MKYLYAKAVGGLLYTLVAVPALTFRSAWTFNDWHAWVFLRVFMVSNSTIFVYVARNDPDLLARRVKTTEGMTSQKIIRFFVNLAFTAEIVLSALDHRFAWSAVSLQVVLVGDGLVALGMLIIFLVFKENAFTAPTVEVEKGQKVISTGLYAVVRHPMYLGGLIFILGIPLALGSLYGLLMIAVFAPVMTWRILDEEKLLAKDLAGYVKYRDTVKYRLVPFVW